MKIVHICISERYIEDQSYQENLLSAKHVQLGHDVYVIAADRYSDKNGKRTIRKPGYYVNTNGVNVTILPPMPQWRFTGTFTGVTIGLYKKLCEINPDIIMVHGVSALENWFVAKYVRSHRRTRLFVDNHNDYYNSPVNSAKKKMLKRIDAYKALILSKYAEIYWGTTPWRVQYLQEVYRIPAEKTGLLIMGADEQYIEGRDRNEIRTLIREQYHIPEDAFVVVTGGTLDKRKQQDLLFEAVSQMEYNNVWLLAFGSSTKEMEQVFKKYESCPNIVMTGWLPAEKAYDMFMASDLAFFPGTHSVLWEQAVACGTPLVVRHWSGMEHVNVNGNALLLDDVNVQNINAIIEKVMDKTIYDTMKNKAIEVSKIFYLTEIAKNAIGING